MGVLSFFIEPKMLLFKQPAGTSRGVYKERRVWYVHLLDAADERWRGIGECAPLPDLSCDMVADYEEVLRRFCENYVRTGALDKEALRPYPSMLLGLETAILSLQASRRGDLHHLFDTPFTRGEAGIPTNGLVWMGTRDEMHARIEEKLRSGSRCVKLKIGAIDFEDEIRLIAELRERHTAEELEIRVDANGGFTAEEALEKLSRLARYDLHSIEQPIRAGQWEQMADLCRRSPLDIALDEELIGINSLAEKQKLLDVIHPQYIILKPSLHGGFSGAEEWMREADKRQIRFWITSALESNVGLNALAQWTSHACAPYYPADGQAWNYQGLGTGQLFCNNYQGTHLSLEGNYLWYDNAGQRAFQQEFRDFQREWADESPVITVQTSGSTGTPKHIAVEKSRMRNSAEMTCRFFGLNASSTALLCMPLRYIAGKMMAVRAFVSGMRLWLEHPGSHPLARLTTVPDFIAMTPHQLYTTLQSDREKSVLRQARHLLVGGGAVSPELSEELRSFLNDKTAPTSLQVWSSYGMTETLSHIALQRLCDEGAPKGYVPLEDVEITIDADGRLSVFAPKVCEGTLQTNDRAEWLDDGSFRILGRLDNVVCSGGLKLQIEEIECRLADLPVTGFLTAVPDARLGEALTLLYIGEATPEELRAECAKRLTKYEIPKHFLRVRELPYTETMKPSRAQLRRLATELMGQKS